jgi:hypothetical protein
MKICKGQTQIVHGNSGELDVLEGRRGAVVVAGRCISARLFPEVARYAATWASNYNRISLLSQLSFLQRHPRLAAYLS